MSDVTRFRQAAHRELELILASKVRLPQRAAAALLEELEQSLATTEADLLVLAAGRAPNHEAALRCEGGMMELRPRWAAPVPAAAKSEPSAPPIGRWSALVLLLRAYWRPGGGAL